MDKVIKNKRGLKLVTSCSSGYKTSSETDYKWENKNFIKKPDTSFQKQTMSYYLFEILLFIIYYELLFNVVYIIHLLNKLSYFPFLDVTCLVACLKCNRRSRKVMSYMMSEVWLYNEEYEILVSHFSFTFYSIYVSTVVFFPGTCSLYPVFIKGVQQIYC